MSNTETDNTTITTDTLEKPVFYITTNGVLRPMTEEELNEIELLSQQIDVNVFVPTSIEMRQLRLQLLNENQLSNIETAISQGDSDNIERLKIEWEYSTVVNSNSELFEFIINELDYDEALKNQFLINASTL